MKPLGNGAETAHDDNVVSLMVQRCRPLLLPQTPTNTPFFALVRRSLARLLSSLPRLAVFACMFLPWWAYAAGQTQIIDLSQRSDRSLTELASEWDQLTPATRRVLLKEMQRRMAQKGRSRSATKTVDPNSSVATANPADGTLRIRTERRFGRRVRQADGSVVTIETRVVQLHSQAKTAPGVAPSATQRPRSVDGAGAARTPSTSSPFGVGFERRSAQRRIVLVPRPAQVPAEVPLPADAQ